MANKLFTTGKFPVIPVKSFIGDVLNAATQLFPKELKMLKSGKEPFPTYADAYYKSWHRREFKGRTRKGHAIIKKRPMSMAIHPVLKNIQIRIRRNISLPISDVVYSYVLHRSPADCANIHIGSYAVWGIDIKNFFPSINRAMVEEIYYTTFKDMRKNDDLKLTDEKLKKLAQSISLLCTRSDIDNTSLPMAVLPIGIEPATSISNAIPLELDIKIAKICRKKNLRYSRYSDNMYFSKVKGHIPRDVQKKIIDVIEDFDFAGFKTLKVHRDKQRYMPYWRQQRILGVVVNTKSNIPRQVEAYTRSGFNHLYWDIHALVNDVDTLVITQDIATSRLKALTKTFNKLAGNLSYFQAVNGEKSDKYSSWEYSIKLMIRYLKVAIPQIVSRKPSTKTKEVVS